MNNIAPMQTVQPARPRDLAPAQLSLVRRTVAKDTNDDEFSMFIEVCRRVGLDPFRRQIYCSVYNKDNPKKRQCVFITGIDGFRAVAARNNNYRPDENEPEITTDPDARDPNTNPTGLVKAAVTVWKRDQGGEWHPLKGIARWEEFAPIEEIWAEDKETGKYGPTGRMALDPKNPRSFWKKMPQLMLAKVAEAQALRRGWPEDLSGIYAPEEVQQAEIAEAAEAVKAHEVEQRLARINAVDTVPVQWNAGDPITFIKDGQFADEVLKFIRKCESPVQIEAWMNINRVGMQQYWALHKADAFELKKQIEARTAALNEPVKEKKEADKLL